MSACQYSIYSVRRPSPAHAEPSYVYRHADLSYTHVELSKACVACVHVFIFSGIKRTQTVYQAHCVL